MTRPPLWTSEELEKDRRKSINEFRRTRIDEPRDEYGVAFDECVGSVGDVLESTLDLRAWDERCTDVLTEPTLLKAARYLAAPPISEDDLKTVAQVASLAGGSLKKRPHDVRKISELILSLLDTRRFPWVADGRDPSEAEKNAAALASAALMATSRVQTSRRTVSKDKQEGALIEELLTLELKNVPRRHIKNLAQAPKRGEFCGESKVGTRKADIVLTLWDDRVVPIECKVSNSALNSLKRLNGDAAVKAGIWIKAFGAEQIVPVAILGGVYDLANLTSAQDSGLCLIWAHDLSPLMQWILSTKPTRAKSKKRKG